MRALRRVQVLAAEVPADVHELDGVERAAPAPRRDGAVRRGAGERILDGHEPRAADLPPARREACADVREQHRVDSVEPAVAHEPGFRGEQLLGDARPNHDRAGQALALHDLLHGERGDDVHGLAGVVTFAVARCAVDHRLPIADARQLRRFRNAVDVGAERDDGLAAAPRRPPRRRHARDAGLDFEAVLFEQAGQIALRLELLERELGEREQAVDDLLRQLLRRIDRRDRFGLETREPRVAAAEGCAGAAAATANDAHATSKSRGTVHADPLATQRAAHFNTGTVFCSEKPSRSTAPSVATTLSPRVMNAASSRTAIPKLPAVSIRRE